MNYKVSLKFKYIYATPSQIESKVSDVLKNYQRDRDSRLEAWIECDEEYDALRIFEITKLYFNKYGQATLIEMTEGKYAE